MTRELMLQDGGEVPALPLTTNIIFLLDESGSMSSAATDVRGGFNTYVDTLAGDGNVYALSAIKFGTTVRPLFANLPLASVPRLTTKNYTPCDSTALYDAIGQALSAADQQWGTPERPYGTDRFLMIIMTDGFENASREYTKEHIVGLIQQHEQAGNWTFIYMGADQDAWGAASSLGFAPGNVMSYTSSDTASVYRNLAGHTFSASTATSPTASRNFFHSDQHTTEEGTHNHDDE